MDPEESRDYNFTGLDAIYRPADSEPTAEQMEVWEGWQQRAGWQAWQTGEVVSE